MKESSFEEEETLIFLFFAKKKEKSEEKKNVFFPFRSALFLLPPFFPLHKGKKIFFFSFFDLILCSRISLLFFSLSLSRKEKKRGEGRFLSGSAARWSKRERDERQRAGGR